MHACSFTHYQHSPIILYHFIRKRAIFQTSTPRLETWENGRENNPCSTQNSTKRCIPQNIDAVICTLRHVILTFAPLSFAFIHIVPFSFNIYETFYLPKALLPIGYNNNALYVVHSFFSLVYSFLFMSAHLIHFLHIYILFYSSIHLPPPKERAGLLLKDVLLE